MQSVESVTLEQYLSVVMETAKELRPSQKRACELWVFYLSSTVMVDTCNYMFVTLKIFYHL